MYFLDSGKVLLAIVWQLHSWNVAETDENGIRNVVDIGTTVNLTGDGSSNSCNGACPNGYRYLITFNSNVGNVPQIVVSKTDLYSGNVAAAASIVVMDGDNSVDPNNGFKLCPDCYPEKHLLSTVRRYCPIPHTHIVTQRVPGNSYYVRVAAANDRGYGQVGLGNAGSTITTPKQQPGVPTNTSVAVYYGDSSKLKVKYCTAKWWWWPILKYMVEYDTTSSFSNAGYVERRCPTFQFATL